MALLNFNFKRQQELERQRLLGESFNRLLGTNRVNVEGSMESRDFDPNTGEQIGSTAPIGSAPLEQERVQPATGFLATDRGPIAQSRLLGALLQSGATVAEGNALLSQIDQGDVAGANLAQNTAVAKAKQDKVIQDRTQSIRKERQVAIKPFVSSINSIGQGIESLQSASGAGDLVGIVSLLKAIDPTSVAREGEVNAVANAAGLIESITGRFNKAIGDGQLSDTARTQLIDQMMILLNRASTNAEGIDKRFSDDAESSGVDPLRLRTNSSLFDEDNKIIRPKRNKTQAQLAAEELARRGIR